MHESIFNIENIEPAPKALKGRKGDEYLFKHNISSMLIKTRAQKLQRKKIMKFTPIKEKGRQGLGSLARLMEG